MRRLLGRPYSSKHSTCRTIVVLMLVVYVVLFLYNLLPGSSNGSNVGYNNHVGGYMYQTVPYQKNKTKRFYVYDWPSNITNLWPQDYTHKRLSIQKRFDQNHGVGELVDLAQGLYHTHQYSLFRLFYHRLLASPQRTMDPEAADLFFIPYDLGMDGSTRTTDGALIQTNCPRVEYVMKILQDKSPDRNPGYNPNNNQRRGRGTGYYFLRKQGKDHFLLHTINQMMLYYANAPCTRLYELCYNCTKLSIDSYPPGVYTHLDNTPFMTHKWISIPFPSNFHYTPGLTSHPPWLNTLQHQHQPQRDVSTTTTGIGSTSTSTTSSNALSTEPAAVVPSSQSRPPTVPPPSPPPPAAVAAAALPHSRTSIIERPYALCFIGTNQVTAKKQKELRNSIIRTCESPAFAPHCLLRTLATHQSLESIYTNTTVSANDTLPSTEIAGSFEHSHRPFTSRLLPSSITSSISSSTSSSNSTIDSSSSSARMTTRMRRRDNRNPLVNPYGLARFCFSPGGDFPTRKGLFDALLSGCIPVIFERETILSQWPLHWNITASSTSSSSSSSSSSVAGAVATKQGTTQLHALGSDTDSSKNPSSSSSSSLRIRGVSSSSSSSSIPADSSADNSHSGIGTSLAEECTVYIPREQMIRHPDEVFAHLLQLSRDQEFVPFIERKLNAIAAVGFRMQYSLPKSFLSDALHPGRRPAGTAIVTANTQATAVTRTSTSGIRKPQQHLRNAADAVAAAPVLVQRTKKTRPQQGQDSAAFEVNQKDAFDVIMEHLLS